MSELDDKIREALAREDAELFDEIGGERSLPELVLETFRGKHRWVNGLFVVVSLVVVAAGVWCAVRFFGTPDVAERLAWGLGVVTALVMVTAIKVWYWMEMQRLAVTRELKRVELQIARLSQRLGQRG